MRRDGIPYVSNGVYNPPFPATPLQDMTLEEIKKKYLKMCAKAQGDPAVCSKCSAPCAEGKRAIQLLANQVYNDPPIPLYGGKTLIEKAREENMLRRQKLEEEKKQKDEKKVPKEKQYIDNWYEDSLASGNQLNWVMEKFNMTKTQAKKKIYSYRYRNGLTNKEWFTQGRGGADPVVTEAEAVREEIKIETPQPKQEATANDTIESKIDSLMRKQAEYKAVMDEHYKEYLVAKETYENFSKKIDVLCSAMDIMNE